MTLSSTQTMWVGGAADAPAGPALPATPVDLAARHETADLSFADVVGAELDIVHDDSTCDALVQPPGEPMLPVELPAEVASLSLASLMGAVSSQRQVSAASITACRRLPGDRPVHRPALAHTRAADLAKDPAVARESVRPSDVAMMALATPPGGLAKVSRITDTVSPQSFDSMWTDLAVLAHGRAVPGAMAPGTPASGAARQGPQQPLGEVLGARLQWLQSQGVDRAVIDLAPHMLGQVRVEIRHEGGVLHVQMIASDREVAQQLQAISDGVRQELGARQFQGVMVQVSQARDYGHAGQGFDGQGRSGREELDHDDGPTRALATPHDDVQAFAMSGGGWVTATE